MDNLQNFDWQRAQEFIERNVGEVSTEDLQEKLAATLADKLGLKSDSKESFIKGEATNKASLSKKAMTEKANPLKKLVKARSMEAVGEIQESKEAKSKLSKDEMLAQTVKTLKESSKMLMDIMQDYTYDMIDGGATAEDIYEAVDNAYSKNPVNADRFLQTQINTLKAAASKSKDPEELEMLDNAITVFQDAQAKLYKEKGRDLQVDRAVQTKAGKADAKLTEAESAEILFQTLMTASTSQHFESQVLSGRDDFESEIVPVISLVLHLASKEINQGQGEVDPAHLSETMNLVKNCQGLMSTFRSNQEAMSVLWRQYAKEIAPRKDVESTANTGQKGGVSSIQDTPESTKRLRTG